MFRYYQPLLYGPIASIPKALLVVVFLWSLFWKGLSLWRSARNFQKYWYFALLIVNTLGILEIVYLAFFQKTLPLKKTKK
jgi:methionyl-tRNA synthetase